MLPIMPSDLMDDIVVTQFTEESALRFRSQLTKKAAMFPDAPIIVYIDSFGGQVDALASMIEAMEQTQNKIITVCAGKAMSCGAILLAAGDYRFCGMHSRIMIHEVSSILGGPIKEIKQGVQELDRLNNYWMDFLAKRCKLKGHDELRQKIKDAGVENLYLTAEQALAFGIVDSIGMPAIRPLITYGVGTIESRVPGGMLPPNKGSGKDTVKGLLDAINKMNKKGSAQQDPTNKDGKPVKGSKPAKKATPKTKVKPKSKKTPVSTTNTDQQKVKNELAEEQQ